MSCTVFAVPYALAWVVGTVITAGVEHIGQKIHDNNNCDDYIVREEHLVEKNFETPFVDKNLLLKTLEEHGVKNISENDYGTISGTTGNYTLTFSKQESDKPYSLRIECLRTDKAEEKVNDLSQEYSLNVQEEAYLSIIDKLKEHNMEVEEEEVQDDNTIVLTINLER